MVFALVCLCLAAVETSAAAAQTNPRVQAMLDRLDERQRREFQTWHAAQEAHNDALDKYWDAVDRTRVARRKKLSAGQSAAPDDYIMSFPPDYSGPALSPPLARIWDELKPPVETTPIPTVDDFLANAAEHYKFVPERIPEAEFKRRYALEALAHGLSKDQVVRVYALETGGQGTHDMQSGINPITKRGTPISTALGYAQLLHANSVNEVVKHGDTFIARLESSARSPGVSAERAAALRRKVQSLRLMIRNARGVRNEWSAHMKFAATPKGQGIHALNLDGDIGPLLQVIKLRGVREVAEKAGRTSLTPNELELMNLAGPATGLEMMTPLGSKAPSSNFFSRGGYTRNPIVHKRSGAELLAQLDVRMDFHVVKPGAVEFGAIFDQILAQRAARR
jgi:hypothetical protein